MLACETLTAPSDFMIRPFGALICCNSARFSGPTSSARQNRAHLKAPAGSLLVLREGKMEKSFRNFQQKASLSVNREGQELVSLLLEIDVVYGSSSVLMLHSVFCPPPGVAEADLRSLSARSVFYDALFCPCPHYCNSLNWTAMSWNNWRRSLDSHVHGRACGSNPAL